MQQQQLTMFRGNTMVFDFAITLGGIPFNLAGAGLWFTAKTAPTVNSAVFQKGIGVGITIRDVAQGTGFIQLAPGDTSGLASRQVHLYFDMELEVAGDVFTIAAGRLVVEPDITVRP